MLETIKPRPLDTIDFAELTPREIAESSLRFGKHTHDFLVTEQRANGNSLHMRLTVRETVDGKPGIWHEIGTHGINAGAHFADNTVGKTTTAITYLLDSDDAVRKLGASEVAPGSTDPAEDPRTWTGAVHRNKIIKVGRRTYTLEAVAACSGIQGVLDRVVSGAIADMWIGQRELQIRAHHALTA